MTQVFTNISIWTYYFVFNILKISYIQKLAQVVE